MNNTVLILEDDKWLRKLLCKYVMSSDDNIDIYDFATKEDALEFIMRNQVDVFLLDIMLDGEDKEEDDSGILFAMEIRRRQEFISSEIIFVTALMGLQAELMQKVHCFDYIEKPFQEERVHKVMKAALHKIRGKSFEEDELLTIKCKGVQFPIMTKEIVMIEGHSRSVVVHLVDEEVVARNISLDNVLKQIQREKFLIPRRGRAVNIRFIKAVDPVNKYVKMYGDKVVDIGRGQKASFMRDYKKLCER